MWADRTAVLVSPWTVVLLAIFVILASPAVLACVLLAALCHELGHYLALRRMGGVISALRITVFGAEMRISDRCRLSYGQELWATAAGPATNLLLAVLLGAAGKYWESAYLLAGSNLVLGVFNLLPVRPLDGGNLLWLLVAWLTDPFQADRVSRWVGGTVTLLLSLLGGWLWYRNGSPFLILGALGFFVADAREKGLVKAAKTR